MLAITLTAPTHCSEVSIYIPKTRLSLCAQVIDWCFCARVFPALAAMLFLPYFARLVLLLRGADLLEQTHHENASD
jgi:hypothetical protein